MFSVRPSAHGVRIYEGCEKRKRDSGEELQSPHHRTNAVSAVFFGDDSIFDSSIGEFKA